MKLKSLMIVALATVGVMACRKKDDPVTANNTGTNNTPQDTSTRLKISFDNVVNGAPVQLTTGKYVNANGDSFSVTMYKYYISNISLYTADNAEYKEPESYHLVNEELKDSKSFTIKDLPAGNYAKIKFLVGVDSARNVSGAQTGALDPLNSMFWDWNTGYIMAKIEGTSAHAAGNNFAFHIGGFTGFYNTLRWVTLTLPANAVVAKGKQPGIHIRSEITEWFQTPNLIDFSKMSFVAATGTKAVNIADNYADMFSVDHID